MYKLYFYERSRHGYKTQICAEVYEEMPTDDEIYEFSDSIDARWVDVYYDKYNNQKFDLFKYSFTI